MKIGDIKNIKIARKYANALLESAVEADKADNVNGDSDSSKVDKDVVQTGDSFNGILYIALLIGAAAVVVTMIICRKRKHK